MKERIIERTVNGIKVTSYIPENVSESVKRNRIIRFMIFSSLLKGTRIARNLQKSLRISPSRIYPHKYI